LNIAIVGTSHLTTEDEKDKALNRIESIFNSYPDDTTYITGDAEGIDKLVGTYGHNHTIIIIKATDKTWGGRQGYKQRNIRIAELADYVYSIATEIKKTRCYHCDTPDHERTGGCWTKRFAIDKLGKEGETIII